MVVWLFAMRDRFLSLRGAGEQYITERHWRYQELTFLFSAVLDNNRYVIIVLACTWFVRIRSDWKHVAFMYVFDMN